MAKVTDEFKVTIKVDDGELNKRIERIRESLSDIIDVVDELSDAFDAAGRIVIEPFGVGEKH